MKTKPTGQRRETADPAPYINERRELEIAVAKARGWTVEPYVATNPVPCSSEVREFDRFRLLDETGAVKGDWAGDAAWAWTLVPQWASISAYRDELERHICERFGDVQVSMNQNGYVFCSIGQNYSVSGTGEGHSFEEKGIAVCRAYLNACKAEAKIKGAASAAVFPRE